MPDLIRLSFSIEQSLLDRLEHMVRASGYANRSEFIRDMIRARIVQQEWERDEETLGTITLIYDHDFRRLNEKLTDLQHQRHGAILATTHIHLDEHLCAEMIMVKGRASEIQGIADLLQQQKGVLHAVLSISSTGKRLS
jgi:CopG family nickel-responsive transcriptional regulator